MSLTPSNPRMMNPAWGGSIKLTPSNSPSLKNTLRSPMKTNRPEASLSLKQVIGTTSSSANAFDSLTSGRSFAFTAGAAAVVATVEDGRVVSQRFYRARPSANPLNPSGSVYGGPSTPMQNESRSRLGSSLRDAGIGATPLASPATDWSDSPQSKTWSTRERIKAATCISFSPDGKFLAVGEVLPLFAPMHMPEPYTDRARLDTNHECLYSQPPPMLHPIHPYPHSPITTLAYAVSHSAPTPNIWPAWDPPTMVTYIYGALTLEMGLLPFIPAINARVSSTA